MTPSKIGAPGRLSVFIIRPFIWLPKYGFRSLILGKTFFFFLFFFNSRYYRDLGRIGHSLLSKTYYFKKLNLQNACWIPRQCPKDREYAVLLLDWSWNIWIIRSYSNAKFSSNTFWPNFSIFIFPSLLISLSGAKSLFFIMILGYCRNI